MSALGSFRYREPARKVSQRLERNSHIRVKGDSGHRDAAPPPRVAFGVDNFTLVTTRRYLRAPQTQHHRSLSCEPNLVAKPHTGCAVTESFLFGMQTRYARLATGCVKPSKDTPVATCLEQ
jgi:hypothetical protein